MHQHANVDLNSLAILGKDFNWNRPKCPNGCPKMWGHGFVLKSFTNFSDGLFIKRYRCPTCKAVITLTPSGHFKRYQSSIKAIYQAIKVRLKSHKWPEWTTRQRARHWMRKFEAFIFMEFPGYEKSTTQLLEYLYLKNIPFLG